MTNKRRILMIFLALCLWAGYAAAGNTTTAVPGANCTLDRVAPRIFSPCADTAVAGRVRFYLNNPDSDAVAIRIFDLCGTLVALNLERETDDVFYWDGVDRDGNRVRGGIYIYQIEVGEKVISGTIVAAR